jgi:membrane-bound ClpP family serine protease
METGQFHIVLGDYDSDLEAGTDYRMINIDNGTNFLIPLSEAYMGEQPITIILETNGGDVKSSDVIFRSILDYPFGVSVYICNFAFSAGTFVSLACGQIFVSDWAVLGPTDPQLTYTCDQKDLTGSSKQFIELNNNKSSTTSERMYMMCLDAKIHHNETIAYISEALTKNGYKNDVINTIIDEFCSGKHSHGRPFNARMLKQIGLHVTVGIPDYVFDINDEARQYKC